MFWASDNVTANLYHVFLLLCMRNFCGVKFRTIIVLCSKLLFWFFFIIIHVGCPGQLTRTTTIPHGPLDILQAQEQVRHRSGLGRLCTAWVPWFEPSCVSSTWGFNCCGSSWTCSVPPFGFDPLYTLLIFYTIIGVVKVKNFFIN